MLWGSREAACWASQLLFRVLLPRGLRLLLFLLRWGERRVTYLQKPLLLGGCGRCHVQVFFELPHKFILLGVFPRQDDCLRPPLPRAWFPRGWWLPPGTQGLHGLPGCLGLLACLLAHL